MGGAQQLPGPTELLPPHLGRDGSGTGGAESASWDQEATEARLKEVGPAGRQVFWGGGGREESPARGGCRGEARRQKHRGWAGMEFCVSAGRSSKPRPSPSPPPPPLRPAGLPQGPPWPPTGCLRTGCLEGSVGGEGWEGEASQVGGARWGGAGEGLDHCQVQRVSAQPIGRACSGKSPME